jgi:glycosyl transferase family 25
MLDTVAVRCTNLIERVDRKNFIIDQFSNKEEFSLEVVDAIRHPVGAYGIWQTLQRMLKDEAVAQEDYFILCQDDHQFTDFYSKDLLFSCIQDADDREADLLSGGVSSFKTGIQVCENLFWMEHFTGLQFTVIFKRFYEKILNATFNVAEDDAADVKLSSLTDRKFVIYPFISVQKEFGYSDVTARNGEQGYVTHLFAAYSQALGVLKNVKEFYKKI